MLSRVLCGPEGVAASGGWLYAGALGMRPHVSHAHDHPGRGRHPQTHRPLVCHDRAVQVLYKSSHRGPIRATPARAGVRGDRVKGTLPHTVERAIASAVRWSLRHCQGHCAVVPKKNCKFWFCIHLYSFSQILTQPERCRGPRGKLGSRTDFLDSREAILGDVQEIQETRLSHFGADFKPIVDRPQPTFGQTGRL